MRQLVLRGSEDLMIDANFDLRTTAWYNAIGDAFETLFTTRDRIISVVDKPPNMSGDEIEITLHEDMLRAAMLRYGFNILLLSIVLSVLVAGMIYAALHFMLVRPMRRLMNNMMGFAQSPEDPKRVIAPSGNRDEIGMAEHELHAMQIELSSALKQKSHLAALGLAVSKVSHDLRNMLTSAQLISDRLSTVNDPTVQRFTPKLIASLDRAIDFLSQTLRFGRAEEAKPVRDTWRLYELCAEVIETAELNRASRIDFENLVPRALTVDADRDQLTRILTNLVRNATQAIEALQGDQPEFEGRVQMMGRREGSVTIAVVTDNGPGLPDTVRHHLFEAFHSSSRNGGTGLGLAISNELAQAHGGYVNLASSGSDGTSFEVHIPDEVRHIGDTKARAQTRAAE